jgi:hypothetical protein
MLKLLRRGDRQMPLVRSMLPAPSSSYSTPALPAETVKDPLKSGLQSYRILVVDDMPSIHQDMR